ncbi:MAG: DUF882 domain-containing protein [Alphaproteobacteria bacterium]|nr:DUF882 domain-containing protein [Alphaproteobacteria bacterium]
MSMVTKFWKAGHRQDLQSRLKKTLVSTAIAGTLALGAFALATAPTVAGGETRTISLRHMHTGESLTITYKKDGKYIPSAMKQINYLLRDWRKNQTVTIDPRTIDLVWELHEDLGSRQPIQIVCGYRSPGTNAFLKRIGRNVAKQSQHMAGRAIDFYFPDVPTIKIRNSALARKVGGVGYYRSSGGPTGFLHADSGSVRHWGPPISNVQMAQIMREGAKTMGRRMRNGGGGSVPAVNDNSGDTGSGGGLIALIDKLTRKAPNTSAPTQVAAAEPAPAPVDAAYAGSEEDMADLSQDAATPPVKKPSPVQGSKLSNDQMASMGDLSQDAAMAPKAKLAMMATPIGKPEAVPPEPAVLATDNGAAEPMVKKGFVVPKPRLKPVEIMLMAAANMKPATQLVRISAASAPPPSQISNDASPLNSAALSMMVEQAVNEPDPSAKTQIPTKKGKGNFAAELRAGTATETPLIKPLMASAGGSDINWWPQLALNPDAAIRRDGAPTLIGSKADSALPKEASLTADSSETWTDQQSADGKGDLLVVNRAGKGSLEMPLNSQAVKLQKIGQLESN